MKRVYLLAGLACLCGSMAMADTGPRSIPFVRNIQVDGSIEQWKDTAPIGNWNSEQNIVYGQANWTGSSDLGGTGWMGWDANNLYIAADVTDDQVRQTGSGENIWRGDHVMVLLNVHPDAKAPPTRFTANGQFMLGLSPGSLATGGDLLSNLPPEVYIWQPQYVGNSGIAVTARKTPKGYVIQAAIPWEFLGVKPRGGMKIDFDLCPSDCDTQQMQQQSMASLVPGKWVLSTARLVHGELAGGPATTAHTSGPRIDLSRQEVQLQLNQQRQFTFEVPQNTHDLAPVVSLEARFASPKLAGTSYGLVVDVNGQPLEPDRCINRPHMVTFASGYAQTLFQGNTWVLIYSPDYKAIQADTESGYYIPPGQFNAYEYRFNVKGLLKSGRNVITVHNQANAHQKMPLAFENLYIQWVPPEQAARQETQVQANRPPVTVRPPSALAPAAHAALTDGGALQFQAAGKLWTIHSQFSQPGGKWVELEQQRHDGWSTFHLDSSAHVEAATATFALDRRIDILSQCIEIHEKLTNLTDQKQPVMVRHLLAVPADEVAALTLNGRPMSLKRGITSDPMNPTILLSLKGGGGVALAPYDGVFRLHHQAFYLNNTAGLADSSLVLAPHATYEQVWQVYSVPSGNYWDLVNAIRQQWDNNFTIGGPTAFVAPRTYPGMQGNFDVEQMKQWIAARKLRIPIVSTYSPVTNRWEYGLATQFTGPAFEKVKHLVQVIHEAAPDDPVLRYFHCFITNGAGIAKANPADAIVDANGHPVVYSGDKDRPLFLPTDTNEYGRQMMQLAKDLIHKFNYNGLYWDEQQDSAVLYDYGHTWDGVSGDIDPKTHDLIRTKSLVPLLSAKFRYNLMDWLAANHLTVVCNGQPYTPEDARYKVHRFVETGSITNLYDTNLFSPVGLGDYLTERTSADTIHSQMQFLNYGAMYDYYPSTIPVENPGLCRWMYPATPIALGPGYLLARERILTNRSGKFSWGDKTLPPVQVHEIDASGKEVKADWKKVSADGIEWVQLQLPPDHAAAIVRQ